MGYICRFTKITKNHTWLLPSFGDNQCNDFLLILSYHINGILCLVHVTDLKVAKEQTCDNCMIALVLFLHVYSLYIAHACQVVTFMTNERMPSFFSTDCFENKEFLLQKKKNYMEIGSKT